MTTPSDIKASYLRALTKAGEVLNFRRISPAATWTARGKVRGYRAEELVGGIDQGWSEVIAYADDFSFPPLPGHKIDFISRVRNVERVDAATVRVQGVTVAYKMSVSG